MRFVTGVIERHARVPSIDKRPGRAYIVSMQEILRSTDPTVIAFASALLSGEDIEVFELDVHMSVLEGSIGVLPRRLMVRRSDAFAARAVLRDHGLPVSETP